MWKGEKVSEEIMEKIRIIESKLKEMDKEIFDLACRVSKLESKVSTLIDAAYLLLKERKEREEREAVDIREIV